MRSSVTTEAESVASLTVSSSRHRTIHLDSAVSKYDPPHGGPADTHVTQWIQERANALIADGLRGIVRMPLERALAASTTHRHEYLNFYVNDLQSVIDMQAIK